MDIPKELEALTPKQRSFVLEYVKEKNGTQAAKKAGYKGNMVTLGAVATENLKKPLIAAAIEAITRPMIEKQLITIETVIAELASLGFGDISQILDFSGDQPKLRKASDIPANARKLISSIKVKRTIEGKDDDAQEVEVVEFKLWDKISALTKLGDHVGAFKKAGDGNEEGPRLQIVKEISEDEARQYLLSLVKKK